MSNSVHTLALNTTAALTTTTAILNTTNTALNTTNTALNTTNAALNTTPTSGKWQHGDEDEASIRELLEVSFWVLMPVVVVVGVAVNALGLYLLRRPRMRCLPATAYMELLLSLDVAVLLVSVSTMLTLNGCHLQSYNVALYFAHPSFTVFYALQTFCHYVIVLVCYDRFLALWCFRRFQQTQQPRVMRLRIIYTGVFCVVVNLRHLLDVEVVCVEDAGIVEAAIHTDGCEEGAWIILDSLHQSGIREVWQKVLRMGRGLLVIVMPVLLVLLFNSGIVIGLVRRRLHNTSATTRTRDQAYSSIYISLAISFTSVTTAMPTIVHASFYASNIKYCHGPYSEEVLRATANLLLLGEHLTHILFLAINQTFRDELRTLLHSTKRCLSNRLSWMTQINSSSRRPRSGMHNKEVVSDAHINIKEIPQVPHLVVSEPEKQPDGETSVEVVALTQASLSVFIADMGLGGQVAVRETHLSEPQHSARTSVVTVEENM